MKRSHHIKWAGLPTLVAAMVLALATSATAQMRTPLSSEVSARGNSGGAQSSSCGFIGSFSQTIQVTESFTGLRIRVQSDSSSATPTLFIQGPGGRNQCARADSFSQGLIEVSGVWEQGTYTVHVGEPTAGAAHAVRLSVLQQ